MPSESDIDAKPPPGLDGVGVETKVGALTLTRITGVKIRSTPINVAVLRGVGVNVRVGVKVMVGIGVGVSLGAGVLVGVKPEMKSKDEQACNKSIVTINDKTNLRIDTWC